jgi:hypothetical protein
MSDIGTKNRTASGVLWVPFLLIAISIMMAACEVALWVYSYPWLYLREDAGFLLYVARSSVLPLFALGVALLLMLMTSAKKGAATRSRLIFVGGVLVLIAGGLINIVYGWDMSYFYPQDFSYDIFLLGVIGQVITIIGTAICALATLFLVISYMNGEIHAKPRD